MKKTSYLIGALFSSLVLFSSCGDDDTTPEPVTITVDSSKPMGATTTVKSGAFVAENGTPTKGTASVVSDEDGKFFLTFSDDFETQLATGTVSVFLAKSSVFSTGMPDGSQKVVGVVADNGATYYKLAGEPAAAYTHVILWCSTAGISFGNSELN